MIPKINGYSLVTAWRSGAITADDLRQAIVQLEHLACSHEPPTSGLAIGCLSYIADRLVRELDWQHDSADELLREKYTAS